MKSKVIALLTASALLCFTGAAASAGDRIKSAEYKNTGVTIDGVPIHLENPLAGIVSEGGSDSKTYMPVRELLEALGYRVEWSESTDMINIIPPAPKSEFLYEVYVGYVNIPFSCTVEELPQIPELEWKVSIEEDAAITIRQGDENGRICSEISGSDEEGYFREYYFTIDASRIADKSAHVSLQRTYSGKNVGKPLIYEIKPIYAQPDKKPVIYLYPPETADVTVKLDYDGTLGYTYPPYNNGWSVTAYPDGTIVNKADGKEYSYLFWDGVSRNDYDFTKGFVVSGDEVTEFLQEKLSYMGLTPREYNEFIVYWAPQMQQNEYNLISFQKERYTDKARLEITPEPDSVLRVFMAFKPLKNYERVEPQVLEPFERSGFTVVEWGGAQVN